MIRPHRSSTGRSWNSLEELAEVAAARMRQGLAPPAEIYQVHVRSHINWADFPEWARPLDPDAFDGCCHEG